MACRHCHVPFAGIACFECGSASVIGDMIAAEADKGLLGLVPQTCVLRSSSSRVPRGGVAGCTLPARYEYGA